MILRTGHGSAAARALLEFLRIKQTHSVSLLFVNEIFPARLQKSIRSSCVLVSRRRRDCSLKFRDGAPNEEKTQKKTLGEAAAAGVFGASAPWTASGAGR